MKFGDGISWDNFVKEALEETKGDIDKIFYKYNPDDLIFANIKKHLVGLDGDLKGKRILDIGSNMCRWIRYFEEGGYIYTAIDQSKDGLEFAKKYYPEGEGNRDINGIGRRFINSYLWDMDFGEKEEDKFDVVVSISVLQHNSLTGKKRILPKIYKVLKDDGIFFIMESTLDHDTNTQLTPSGWISLIESNGFRFTGDNWHPSGEKQLNDCYIFRKIPGLDIKAPEMKKGSDEELDYYVETCYLNILGRGADDLGRKSYVDLIKSGRMKRQYLPIELRSSDEYKNRFKKRIGRTEESNR